MRCSAFVQLARPVEVLADLQRRLQLGGEPGVAVEIVVDDRLLDPVEAQVVDHVAAVQRLGEIQALIEIDHQLDVIADRLADGVDASRGHREAFAAEPQLEPGETTLVAQLHRFRRDGLRLPSHRPLLL